MTQVSSENDQLPTNLYLVAGDGNLELLAAPLAYYANAQFPQGVWGAVHKWVLELLEQITNDQNLWTIFIDTNPSFSIYTELAMIGATKLIVPFNADDSSRHAVSAIFRLLYGAGKANPVYDNFTFRKQTELNSLTPPLCHLFVGNRLLNTKALRLRSRPCQRQLRRNSGPFIAVPLSTLPNEKKLQRQRSSSIMRTQLTFATLILPESLPLILVFS